MGLALASQSAPRGAQQLFDFLGSSSTFREAHDGVVIKLFEFFFECPHQDHLLEHRLSFRGVYPHSSYGFAKSSTSLRTRRTNCAAV